MRRVIEISRSLIWSKTLMEQIYNPCGEFRWSPDGPVSQIHSPQLHVGAPGIFFRSFKVCPDAKERLGCGNQRETTAPIHEFAVEDLPSAEQQWRTWTLRWNNIEILKKILFLLNKLFIYWGNETCYKPRYHIWSPRYCISWPQPAHLLSLQTITMLSPWQQ